MIKNIMTLSWLLLAIVSDLDQPKEDTDTTAERCGDLNQYHSPGRSQVYEWFDADENDTRHHSLLCVTDAPNLMARFLSVFMNCSCMISTMIFLEINTP